MKNAVLLLSGGLDSAANLALGEKAGFQVRLALTIDYGQKSAKREKEQAAKLARHFGVEQVVVDFQQFASLSGAKSALHGGVEIPTPRASELDDLNVVTESAKAVWVPNRNGVFISIAAAVAEARGLDAVAVGFNAEEAVTFPDNSEDYMRAMTESLRFSTANAVNVVSATSGLRKPEIVREILARDFPINLIWSCYALGDRHCGRCESCQRFKRALPESVVGLVFGGQP